MTTETKRRRLRRAQKKRNDYGHRAVVVKIGNGWLSPFSRANPSAAFHRTVLLSAMGYKFEFHDWPTPLFGRMSDIIGWLDNAHQVENDHGLMDKIKAIQEPEVAAWFSRRAAHDLLTEIMAE